MNRTPAGIAPANRQAFLPSVAVSEHGTIGVSWYDFRFNDAGAGSLTDHWFAWCQPDAVDCSQPSRWAGEVRLTGASFDILPAPAANGLFLGDYVGLAAGGGGFVPLFTRPEGPAEGDAPGGRL